MYTFELVLSRTYVINDVASEKVTLVISQRSHIRFACITSDGRSIESAFIRNVLLNANELMSFDIRQCRSQNKN